MLNGELKQLYTAITRARVNLWIFDENHEKRAPAFDYFVRGNFVQVVKTDRNKGMLMRIFFIILWKFKTAFFQLLTT